MACMAASGTSSIIFPGVTRDGSSRIHSELQKHSVCQVTEKCSKTDNEIHCQHNKGLYEGKLEGFRLAESPDCNPIEQYLTS